MFYRIHNKKINMIALQAQVQKWNRTKASFDNTENSSIKNSRELASVTVEAAVILPFFFCAICTVCVIGQFFLAESAIYHALAQTARVYAKQESALELRKKVQAKADTGQVLTKSNSQDQESMLTKVGGFLETAVIFSRYIEKKDVDSSYVYGGRKGIVVTVRKDGDYVKAQAQYILRVPVPFFKLVLFTRKLVVRRRLFTGYVPYTSHQDGNGNGQSMVYVAKNGKVYHTSMDCYHLCITIKDPQTIQQALKTSSYNKCKKCMKSGETPSQIYISKEGDCIHSSLACSGLKREISAVNVDSLSGMRECSECSKH